MSTNTKNRVLSIDPGESAGFSFFIFNKVVESGTITGTLENYKEILLLLNRLDPNILIIENQFFGKNPKTLIRLVERRCIWQIPSLIKNVTIHLVSPRAWQAYWDLSVDRKIKSPYQRNKNLKQKIRLKAESLAGKKFDFDEADSYLQGRYVIEKLGDSICEKS